MSYVASITDSDVFSAVRDWLLSVLGGAGFTGTIVGDVLTVASVLGSVEVGQLLRGEGVPSGVTVAAPGALPNTYQLSSSVGSFGGVKMTTGIEVVQGIVNRVPSPAGGFVLITRISKVRLSTDVTEYTDPLHGPSSVEYLQSTDYQLQFDFFGEDAADWAQVVSTLWRSLQACDFLKPYGIQPLYNDDPRQVPMVTGEKQYEQRWVMTTHLNYTPKVSVPQDFFDAVDVGVISVDATYAP